VFELLLPWMALSEELARWKRLHDASLVAAEKLVTFRTSVRDEGGESRGGGGLGSSVKALRFISRDRETFAGLVASLDKHQEELRSCLEALLVIVHKEAHEFEQAATAAPSSSPSSSPAAPSSSPPAAAGGGGGGSGSKQAMQQAFAKELVAQLQQQTLLEAVAADTLSCLDTHKQTMHMEHDQAVTLLACFLQKPYIRSAFALE